MKNVSVALIGARMRTPPWHSFLCISSAILVITVVLNSAPSCVTSAPAGRILPAAPTETISPPAAGDIHKLSNTSSSSCRGEPGVPMNTLVPIPGLTGSGAKRGTIRLRAGSGNRTCVKPYHDQNDGNLGDRTGSSREGDIDGGKMDGSSGRSRPASESHARIRSIPIVPAGSGQPDVMGYHDSARSPITGKTPMSSFSRTGMFEPSASWSLPSHLSSSRPGREMQFSRPDEPVSRAG